LKVLLKKQFSHGVLANTASSAVAAQLFPPKLLTGAPLLVIYKNVLTLCYISRPNGLQNKIS